jgi:hypothetical protein
MASNVISYNVHFYTSSELMNCRVQCAGFLSASYGFGVQVVCIGFVSGKVALTIVLLDCLPFRLPFIILSIYSSQPLKCEKVFIQPLLVSLGPTSDPPPFQPKSKKGFSNTFLPENRSLESDPRAF